MGLFGKNKDKESSRQNSKGRGLGRTTSDTDVMIEEAEFEDDVVISRPSSIEDDFESVEYGLDNDDNVTAASAFVDEIEQEKSKSKKGGLFGNRKPKAPKAVKDKKAAKEKPVKKNRGKEERERKEAEIEQELSTRLSVLVEIEELPGVTKEDAIETARHQALNHSERPSNCYFNVLETRNGYLIEVQEGVGRSYLNSIYRLALDNPGRIVVVPMVRRKLTVIYSPKTDSFDTQILSEDVDPPEVNGEKPLLAKRGSAMTPVFKQYHQWLVSGVVTAGIGALSLISSLAFYAFDPGVKPPPEWRTTNIAQLPVMQWSQLSGGASDSYVVRFEYTDGQWRVVRQTTFAQVDVSEQGELDSAPVIGGNVTGPATPDVTGSYPQPGVPAGATPASPAPAPAPAPAPPAGLITQ